MRLNQFIAKATGISRRTADQVIKSKQVKVNGLLGELSHQVVPSDIIEIWDKNKWKIVSGGIDSTSNGHAEDAVTVLLLYKPPRVMTTRSDPEGRKTIYDYIPQHYKSYKSAGRLDYMSEGLLLLSPNGHLILSLTHPKFKTAKSYLVGLDAPLSVRDIERASGGQMDIDGYTINPVHIIKADTGVYSFLHLEKKLHWYQFTLSEGRNRQIRKMTAQLNKHVIRLIRVSHGPFEVTPSLYTHGYEIQHLAS